jgi:hypothetical protein
LARTLCSQKIFEKLKNKILYSGSIGDFQKETEEIEGITINPEITSDSLMSEKNAFVGQKIFICRFLVQPWSWSSRK